MAPSGLPTSATNTLKQSTPTNPHTELQNTIVGLDEILKYIIISLQGKTSQTDTMRYFDTDNKCYYEVTQKNHPGSYIHITISRTHTEDQIGGYYKELEIEEMNDGNEGYFYRCRSPLNAWSDIFIYSDGTVWKPGNPSKLPEAQELTAFNLLFINVLTKATKDIDLQRNLINVSTSTNKMYMPKLWGLVDWKEWYTSGDMQDKWEGKDKSDQLYSITKLKTGPDHGQTKIMRKMDGQIVEFMLNGNNKLIAKKVGWTKVDLEVSDVTEFAAWLTDVVALLGKA
jgi:hypothetical protein